MIFICNLEVSVHICGGRKGGEDEGKERRDRGDKAGCNEEVVYAND